MTCRGTRSRRFAASGAASASPSRQCLELEIEDLIQQGLGGWALTDTGNYRLERGH